MNHSQENLSEDHPMDDIDGFCSFKEADEKTFFDKVCESYMENKNLIAHQIGSYNRFLDDVQSVFEEASPITVNPTFESQISEVKKTLQSAEISFGNVKICKPTCTDTSGIVSELYPSEARLRKMTYNASLYADIKLKVSESLSTHIECEGENMSSEEPQKNDLSWIYTGEENDVTCTVKEGVLKNIFVGKIPVMLMSNMCYLSAMRMEDQRKKGQCHFDIGGYFIVNGSEKVVISQGRPAARIFCSNLEQKKGLSCLYTSSSTTKNDKVVKRRTRADIIFSSLKSNNQQGVPFLKVYFFGLKASVPAIIVFRALGVLYDKEIIERICEDVDDDEMVNLIYPSIYQADEITSSVPGESTGFFPKKRQSALKFLETKITLHLPVEDILRESLFPHLHNDCMQKVMLLGYMFNCLLSCHLQRRKLDAKNDFKFKRIALTGDLCREKLSKLVHLVLRNLKKGLDKIANNAEDLRQHLHYHIDGSIITKGFIYALSTGNWGDSMSGLAVTLKRTNVLDTLSHLRQIRLPAPGFVKVSGRIFRQAILY